MVLTSTYCLCLDNSKVKKVVIMGGCRSAADALQSAGTIQLKQQSGEGSKVIFWKDDSSTKRRSKESILSPDYCAKAHLYDAFKNLLSLTEQSSAKAYIAGLYKTEGLKRIIYEEPNQRIRADCILRCELKPMSADLCVL